MDAFNTPLRRLQEAWQMIENPQQVKSANWILKHIDINSKGHLNYSQLRSEIAAGGAFYTLKEIPLEPLDVQDEDLVNDEIKDTFSSDIPIVVGNDNYVIDGRHRVVNAKRKGETSIMAWVPVENPSGEDDDDQELSEMPSLDNDLLDYTDDNPINRTKAFKYDSIDELMNDMSVGISKFKTSDSYKADFINNKTGRVFGQAYFGIINAVEFDPKTGENNKKKYFSVNNIKISKDFQGQGVGYNFYKYLITKVKGIDGLLSDTSLTKKGKRGSFYLWDKLSKEFEVHAVTDRGDGSLTWKPLKNLSTKFGKGHGRVRYGIKKK